MQSPSLPRMPSLSVVIPVFNERGNIGPLVQEVVHHLRGKSPSTSSVWTIAPTMTHARCSAG